jgi:predicted histidine transporter YuiF (NhaC family)
VSKNAKSPSILPPFDVWCIILAVTVIVNPVIPLNTPSYPVVVPKLLQLVKSIFVNDVQLKKQAFPAVVTFPVEVNDVQLAKQPSPAVTFGAVAIFNKSALLLKALLAIA